MKQTFEELKKFMHVPMGDVHDWNAKREEAKEIFPQKLINELDSSGYIRKLLKVKRHRVHITHEN